MFTKSSNGFQINKFNVEEGKISAVVTTFKNYDVVNDVMMPGSLDNYIKGFEGNLPMLYQHEKNEMIGIWNKLTIDGDKVIGDGMIFPEVTRGKDTMALISRGLIGSTSIGFKATDYEQNDEGGLNFKEIELVEISMVRSPANPKAQLLSAKNADGEVSLRNIERILRESGLSKNQSQAFISKGFKALNNLSESELKSESLLSALQSFNK